MSGRFNLNIDAEVRRANRRTKREEKTPLVVYTRGGSYGLARLANIRDYMSMHSWPPDYSAARVITNPDDLQAIEQAIENAEQAIRAARKAADQVYAKAFGRGATIDPAEAEAAARAVEAAP